MSEQKNENKPKIFYLCDGRACDSPCNPACHYTSNIEHASYFEKVDDGASYWEKDGLVRPGKAKNYDNVIPVSWIDEWSLSNQDGSVVDMLSDWIEDQKSKWNPLSK